jgi:hypothetical protein
VHLVGFLFIVVIADARNHEPEIYRQIGRTEDSWEDKVYYYGNNIPKMTRNEILKNNKADNIRINPFVTGVLHLNFSTPSM